MPTETYGKTQVREIRLTEAEVKEILLENLHERAERSYDFDYDRPIILKDDGGYIFRFVQRAVTQDKDPRRIEFKPMPESQ